MLYAIDNNGIYSGWTVFFVETDIDEKVLLELIQIPRHHESAEVKGHTVIFKGSEVEWFEGKARTLEAYVKDWEFQDYALNLADVDGIPAQWRIDVLNKAIESVKMNDVHPEDREEWNAEAHDKYHNECQELIGEYEERIKTLQDVR